MISSSISDSLHRLNNDHIHIIEQEMRRAIVKGLNKDEHGSASVKCFPTYVRNLPNGKEHGKFLSLDLGGTNFRVIVMELTPDQEFLMDNKIYAVPHEIMTGSGEGLFDHIGKQTKSKINISHKLQMAICCTFHFSELFGRLYP